MILQGVRIAGSWSFWYEGYFKCGGFNSRDRICVKDLDGKFDQYERSINPAERKKLAERSSAAFSRTTIWCRCFARVRERDRPPRRRPEVAGRPDITTGYAYPWEDLKVRTSSRATWRDSSSAASSTASSRSSS